MALALFPLLRCGLDIASHPLRPLLDSLKLKKPLPL